MYYKLPRCAEVAPQSLQQTQQDNEISRAARIEQGPYTHIRRYDAVLRNFESFHSYPQYYNLLNNVNLLLHLSKVETSPLKIILGGYQL